MRKVTKGLAPLVALALVAAACGGDDDDDSADEPADDTEEPAEEPADDMEEPADDMEEPAEEPADASGEVATDVGVTEDSITVALLSDLTGPFSPTVVPLTDGAEAYWERLNANGGVAGRTIEFETVDTGYDVPTHQQYYDDFSSTGEDGAAFIAFSTGSPHTASIRDDLTADGLGAIPLSWNSSWATDASSNIFEWGTPYCVEAMNGVTWLAEENDASTIAIVGVPGDYGEDGSIGAKIAAEELGLEVVYDGQGAVAGGADQTPVITSIVDSGADIVWLTLTPGSFSEIIGGAAAAGYTGQFGGNGPTYAPQLMATEIGPVIDEQYTHFTPYPGFNGVDAPGMDEIVSLMREDRPDAPFQAVYVASWIQGEILRQGLETAAANGDMTRQGIVDALQETEVDLQGVIPNVSYSGDPNDQITRSSFVWDISADAADGDATVQDDDGDGLVLIDPEYTSDTAANWDYSPCFEI